MSLIIKRLLILSLLVLNSTAYSLNVCLAFKTLLSAWVIGTVHAAGAAQQKPFMDVCNPTGSTETLEVMLAPHGDEMWGQYSITHIPPGQTRRIKTQLCDDNGVCLTAEHLAVKLAGETTTGTIVNLSALFKTTYALIYDWQERIFRQALDPLKKGEATIIGHSNKAYTCPHS